VDKVDDPLSGTAGNRFDPDARLDELGLTLPEEPSFPVGQEPKLEPVAVVGDVAYLSGVGPLGTTGVVGDDLDVDAGYRAARETALLCLRRIHDRFGSLDAVDRWLKVTGFVRSAGGFGMQPAVLNGFSELIIAVYGVERGRCARSAIGVSELPMNIPVEVEAIVQIRTS
jgi:enamine deaminase RidA (YjgF/YER057c/UK114 family)